MSGVPGPMKKPPSDWGNYGYSIVRTHPLPDWMKDPTKLPKKPPQKPKMKETR